MQIQKSPKIHHSCIVCHSTSAKIISNLKTINPNSDIEVQLLECENCKHWSIDPTPSQKELSDMYSSNSEFVVPRGYSDSMSSTQLKDTCIFSDLLPSRSFNYLELGIGSGQVFEYFKKRADFACGIEPGKWVVYDNGHIVPDIKDVPDVKFNLVVANDVLEHLSNPAEMLQNLNSVADEGCIMFATFPNKDSLKAQILKERWSMVRPFGHLHFFSKKSIKIAYENAGWNVIKIKAIRAGRVSTLDLIRGFDTKQGRVLYRLFSSLIPGQILLGKDQWEVTAVKPVTRVG